MVPIKSHNLFTTSSKLDRWLIVFQNLQFSINVLPNDIISKFHFKIFNHAMKHYSKSVRDCTAIPRKIICENNIGFPCCFHNMEIFFHILETLRPVP